jgi:class 3 adenylate cyclase
MFAMPALPEGVLTLFFSDVEGSTRLAKSHGDAAWAEQLETHRALLRQAFAAHGGLEVDTQGDSFFAVFRMASDAVAAALAAQRSLAAQAWPSAGAVRVRIGLHTGEAIARGDHYVGQEIHRASRICDAGHGGQIVVSQTTAELVRGSLPDGATLAPLGDYRLKDLGQPQRLFQLDATGLAGEFPALRSLDIPTNLPTERSSFIGREADISAIRERLAGHRLVTLTGIGGSGKTRLALQVGALELGNFADGVFFVDLAPISDAQLLASTVASACGLMLGDASGAGVARSKTAWSRRWRGASRWSSWTTANIWSKRWPTCSTASWPIARISAARHQPRGAGCRGRADRAGVVARRCLTMPR